MKNLEDIKDGYVMSKGQNISSESADSQVTHEAETQRQHVRVQVPAVLSIRTKRGGAERFSISEMSASGFSFDCDEDTQFDSATVCGLSFPFKAYSLAVKIKFSVVEREGRTVHARFEDLTADTQSVLRHIIGAYISGDIVSANEMIHVVSRDNFSKTRNTKKEKNASVLRSILSAFVYTLLGLAAAAFLVHSLYKLTAVSDSIGARVSADTVQVTMPRGGVFHDYVKNVDKVTLGQSLGKYSWVKYDENGDAREESKLVISPCDCFIQEHNVEDGALVGQGQPLYQLVQGNEELFIDARFDYPKTSNFKIGDIVSYTIAGSDKKSGQIVKIKAELDAVEVRIRTDDRLDSAVFGMPASVQIDRWNLLPW